MKAKQMDEVNRIRKKLGSHEEGSPPSLARHVAIALCSGEVPKLKPAHVISKAARGKIIDDRYSNRALAFEEIFASTNGYESEMEVWRAYQDKRRDALARFEKAADKIMLQALDPEAVPESIVEQLHEAAESSGMSVLKAPKFTPAS